MRKWEKRHQIRRQKKIAKVSREIKQSKEHPSGIVKFSQAVNNGMNKPLYKVDDGLHKIQSRDRLTPFQMTQNIIDFIIQSKLYLFLLVTFVLLFLPIAWKDGMAMSNSHWVWNLCDVPFFIHTDLIDWTTNMVVIIILMPLIYYMLPNKDSRGKIVMLWLVFLLGGYLADVTMCVELSMRHVKYSVVGSSGGICALMGFLSILYISRLCKAIFHKMHFYHKVGILFIIFLTMVCYLDSHTVRSMVVSPVLNDHRIGLLFGILMYIVMSLCLMIVNHHHKAKNRP